MKERSIPDAGRLLLGTRIGDLCLCPNPAGRQGYLWLGRSHRGTTTEPWVSEKMVSHICPWLEAHFVDENTEVRSREGGFGKLKAPGLPGSPCSKSGTFSTIFKGQCSNKGSKENRTKKNIKWALLFMSVPTLTNLELEPSSPSLCSAPPLSDRGRHTCRSPAHTPAGAPPTHTTKPRPSLPSRSVGGEGQ